MVAASAVKVEVVLAEKAMVAVEEVGEVVVSRILGIYIKRKTNIASKRNHLKECNV